MMHSEGKCLNTNGRISRQSEMLTRRDFLFSLYFWDFSKILLSTVGLNSILLRTSELLGLPLLLISSRNGRFTPSIVFQSEKSTTSVSGPFCVLAWKEARRTRPVLGSTNQRNWSPSPLISSTEAATS